MLWLFVAVGLLAFIILALIEPGVIGDIMEKEEIEGMKIPELSLLLAILVLVPLTMTFMSLTLNNPANRWANIIVGAVFAVLESIDFIEAVAQLSAWATLVTLSKIVALALIVWYAWKSK